MIWPKDEADAARKFDRTFKQYISTYHKVARGEVDWKKLANIRDRLSELYRWVDDGRKESLKGLPTIEHAMNDAREARTQGRNEMLANLRDQKRAESGTALGQYQKELHLLRGRK